jgi:hypothetical protein
LNLEHTSGLDRDVSSLSGEAPELVAALDLKRDRAPPGLAVDENLERGAWMKRAAPPRGKKDERKEEQPPEGESASPEPAFSRRSEPEE